MPSVWNFQDGVIMVGGSLLQFGCLNIITWQKSAIRQIPCFSYNNPIFCPYWFTTLHQHMVFFWECLINYYDLSDICQLLFPCCTV
jgi:hypothetical protein